MDPILRVRTGKRISLSPFSTVDIPIRSDGILDLDKLQFTPRHRIPHLSVSVQMVIPEQPFLRACNKTSRPIKIPRNTKLGKFKPRATFRFYDLPRELRELILDIALADAHPGLKALTLKYEPGFVKNAEDGSISMTPTNAGKFGSRYVGCSIAFPFMSKCSLTLTSKTLADDFQTALWRFLLREGSSWLKLRVHNFSFETAHFFLARCSQHQQLSGLRLPGKLVLQLSLRCRSAFGPQWAWNAERWSEHCLVHKVSPWVVFTEAFFLQRQCQRPVQQALANACQRATKGPTGDQVVMISDALDGICKLNRWTRNGYWLDVHKRTDEMLGKEEYYFKGVEYDSDGALVDQRFLGASASVRVGEK
ncbi:hypothetical protein MBLNU13_g10991t1 [Cladosporium sp. NU13]